MKPSSYSIIKNKANQRSALMLFFLFSLFQTNASTLLFSKANLYSSTAITSSQVNFVNQLNLTLTDFDFKQPNPALKKIIDKILRRKKITAAVLAFPLPFGIIGLHRIYLGTKPYVPLMYIATVGGAFGVLPFVDFWAILFDKEFTRFEKNEKIFMWINK